MRSAFLLMPLVLCLGGCVILAGCDKDDSTSPEDLVPTVNVTLASSDLVFGAYDGAYNSNMRHLIMGFFQGQSGGFPTCVITLSGADTVETGVEVNCGVIIYPDSANSYVCGSLADSDSAVSVISFRGKDLRQGGLVSGDVNGMAEHNNHGGEALVPVIIQFRNIPLEITN